MEVIQEREPGKATDLLGIVSEAHDIFGLSITSRNVALTRIVA